MQVLRSAERDMAEGNGKSSLGLPGGYSALQHEVQRRSKPGAVSARFAVDQERIGTLPQDVYQSQELQPSRPLGRAQWKVIKRQATFPGRSHFRLIPPIRGTSPAQVEYRLEMKVPHQLRQLRGRLRRSDDSSRVDNADITPEQWTPDFPDQSERTDQQSDERRSWGTPLYDRIRDQRAVPFDRDSANNHKSPCASTTFWRRIARHIAQESGSSHDLESESREMKSGRFPPNFSRETGPTGDSSQHS